jgi:uncharacterized protein
LLFLDEIQSCLPAISSLRFFHEKRPGLHIVAAGSLLEFALKNISSFGVGRIQFLFMYPLSFIEFLWANNENRLHKLIMQSDSQHPINEVFHKKLVTYLKQFLFTGGLPEVVDTFVRTGDLRQAQTVLDMLINGLEDDFAKYRRLVSSIQLREVFESITAQTVNRFTISKAFERMSHQKIRESLILFDHGVFQRLLGLELSQHLIPGDFEAINKGNLAEQFAGTEFLKYAEPYNRRQLYYWHREKKGSNAEVDYVIQRSDQALPIEVKSGKQGKMQSLWMFLKEKKIDLGVSISLENFARYPNIDVFPLYAIQKIFN